MGTNVHFVILGVAGWCKDDEKAQHHAQLSFPTAKPHEAKRKVKRCQCGDTKSHGRQLDAVEKAGQV